jgi:hypothetical protein
MSDSQKTQAESSGGLDQLFRSALENDHIKPSGGVWKGISRKLLRAELARFNFTNLHKAFWVAGAGALVVGFIFLFTQLRDGTTTENASASLIPDRISSGNSIPDITSAKYAVNNSRRKASQEYPSSKSIRKNSTSSSTTYPAGSQLLASNNSIHTYVNQEHDAIVRTNSMTIAMVPWKLHSLVAIEDTLLRFTTLNGINNIPLVTKVKTPQFFSLDMGITPEVSVYRNANQYSETNYWLNAGVTYHAGRFSVQTGVGLGYVYDHGDYRVNYKSKDSIGYFTSIISFIVTPNNEVIFTTKDIAVYDSLQHAADSRALSRYTYLQIPLLLGFELLETNRLSVTLKAGPAVSFLIGSKEAAPFIDYPNARLIRVDNNSLTRVKMNWEIQAALDIEYRLVKNFSIYAQPSYKHYFKAFETPESTPVSPKDPYSIGITIGARYNFGLKHSKP